jgi:hypothetical protein
MAWREPLIGRRRCGGAGRKKAFKTAARYLLDLAYRILLVARPVHAFDRDPYGQQIAWPKFFGLGDHPHRSKRRILAGAGVVWTGAANELLFDFPALAKEFDNQKVGF